jgi:hypothetical protein
LTDALDYDKIIEMVDAEGAQPSDASVSIDLSSAFADEIEVKELKYADVSAIVEGVEPRKESAPEIKQQQPEVQAPVAIPKHETSKEMEGAAGVLKGMVGGAGNELEETVTKEVEKKKGEDLVMPSLSVQDQLADLEKIAEGIKERAFDKEQLKIISQEVAALSSEAGTGREGLGEEQLEIVMLRDQKVKEIKGKLHMR